MIKEIYWKHHEPLYRNISTQHSRQQSRLRRKDVNKEDGRKKYQPHLAALNGQPPVKVIKRRSGRTFVTSEHILRAFKGSAEYLR